MISSSNCSCTNCGSEQVYRHQKYSTKSNGRKKLYCCKKCGFYFSETSNTPAAGLKTALSRVSEILLARAEGLGFNAACRVFKIG